MKRFTAVIPPTYEGSASQLRRNGVRRSRCGRQGWSVAEVARRSGSRVNHVTSDRRGIREILDDVALGLTLVEKRQERARTFLSGFAARAQPAKGPSLPRLPLSTEVLRGGQELP